MSVSDVREQTENATAAADGGAPAEEKTGAERTSQETRVRRVGPEEGPSPETESSPEAAPAGVGPGDGDVDGGGDADEGDDADERVDRDDDHASALESEAEIAADYLEELLDIADLDGDIDTYIEGDRAHVSIVSESRVLVGERGEVLDALQELTRLAVMTETGERSRLMLDVAGFRARRREQLLELAAEAVDRAKTTGQPVPLAAMNPFERKIVHDAVASAGLFSESEGDEPERHVVVQSKV
jgi:spoIIIJ-associated protein